MHMVFLSKQVTQQEWFQAVEARNYEFIEANKAKFRGLQDAELNTALIAATRNNDLRMIGILVQEEANIVNADRKTACMVAIENDSLKAFYLLQPFEMREDTPKVDQSHHMQDANDSFNYFIPILSQNVYISFAAARLKILFHALTTGLLNTVKHIVEHKINWKDSYIKACVMVSIAYGHCHIAAYFLHYCIDIGALNGCDLYKSIQLDDSLGYPLADTAFADLLLQPAAEKATSILNLVKSLNEKTVPLLMDPGMKSSANRLESPIYEQINISNLDRALEVESIKGSFSQLISVATALQDEVVKLAADNETMKLAIEATVSNQDAQTSIMQLTAELADLRKELEWKEGVVREMKERAAAASVYTTVALTASELPLQPQGATSTHMLSRSLVTPLGRSPLDNKKRVGMNNNALSDEVIELGRELNLVRLELEKRQAEVNESMNTIQNLRKELRLYRPQVGKLTCFSAEEKI